MIIPEEGDKILMLHNSIISRLLTLIFCLLLAQSGQGRIIYVDSDAPLPDDGTSWSSAYWCLQNALDIARYSDEIRVAKGTYKPDQRMVIGGSQGVQVVTSGDREATFQLISGVTLKGGYAGYNESNPDARDVDKFTSILNGDIGEATNLSDNSLNVVTGSSMDATAILDGFTVSAGRMYNKAGHPTLINCTFRDHYYGGYGGGMYNSESNPTLIGCAFIDNGAYYGGAMYNIDSSPVLDGCIFYDNFATYAGAVHIKSQGGDDPIISNCAFYGNKAEAWGGAITIHDCNALIVNCLFSGNVAIQRGGAMYYAWDSNVTITNCTFSGNRSRVGGAIANNLIVENNQLTLNNCILWGNVAEYGSQIRHAGRDPLLTISYCDIQGGMTDFGGGWGDIGGIGIVDWGAGNLYLDPLFMDPNGMDNIFGTPDDNLHLRPGSPVIDAGDNESVPEAVLNDLEGRPRFVDDPDVSDTGRGSLPVVDIGAYEGADEALQFILNTESIQVPEGGINTFTIALADDPYRLVEVEIVYVSGAVDVVIEEPIGGVLYFDSENYSVPQTVTVRTLQDHDYLDDTALVQITAPGYEGSGVTIMEEDRTPVPRILYVDRQAPGRQDGTNWANAFNDLQPALRVAQQNPEVAEIRVSAGKYKPAGLGGDRQATFEMVEGLALRGGYASYGGFDPNHRDIHQYETILSGDLNDDDVDVEDPRLLRDEPSRADNSYHVIICKGTDQTAILDGFVITGGNAEDECARCYLGGGLYIDGGTPTIVNCTFAGNAATYGGGISTDFLGNPTIVNCTFRGNAASVRGGGIYQFFWGGMTITNSCFSGNYAYEGGGINVTGVPGAKLTTVTNCTFSKNTAVAGGGLYNLQADILLSNCIVWGNSATEGSQMSIYAGHDTIGKSTVVYSSIEGGRAGIHLDDQCILNLGKGNIQADPLFVDADGPDNIAGTSDDNLRLLPNSPCIDAGDNAIDTDLHTPGPQGLLGVDADLNCRRFDDSGSVNGGNGRSPIVDMGPYEYGGRPIPSTLYVDVGTSGPQLGTSWANAFAELRTALNTAAVACAKVNQLWVAEGNYTPAPPGGERKDTFRLMNGLAVYGGFPQGGSDLAGRDPGEYETVLCGDTNDTDGRWRPGLGSKGNNENSFHVVDGSYTDSTAILDGFTIRGGHADGEDRPNNQGAGMYMAYGSPTVKNCVFTQNTASKEGGCLYCLSSIPIFENCIVLDNIPDRIGIEHGGICIAGTLQLVSTDLMGNNIFLDGEGSLLIDLGTVLKLNDSEVRCNILGPGFIDVTLGSDLVIESDAIVDLGSDTDPNGQIVCNGLLHLRDEATLINTDISVLRASFEDDVILLNCIITAEAEAPYGQFFIEDSVTISGNDIHADGDRYMDFDPSVFRGIIENNSIYVTITEGQNNTRGGLLELRGKDFEIPPCEPNEFIYKIDNVPSFNTTTWTIEQLELAEGAKVNLTNRFDFQYPYNEGGDSEVLYVKHLILRPNSILNTSFNYIYYETKDIDESAQVVNLPLLGFSLNNISFDDENDYIHRVKHNNFIHHKNHNYDRIHVSPVPVTGFEPDLNGMMQMRNIKDLDPNSPSYKQVINARGKGLFSKSNEDQILVMFEYLFETDGTDFELSDPIIELVVYLSDVPELQTPRDPHHHIKVGRIRPPRRGRPGSVDSGRFGIFHTYTNRGQLDFIRGTRVELELIGPEGASVLINNWDPQIQCSDECMNLDGEAGVTVDDLKPILGAFGSSAGLGGDGMGSECVDGVLSGDGHVDSHDVIGGEWAIINQDRSNLCPETKDRSIPLDPGLMAYPSYSMFESRPTGNTGKMYSSFYGIPAQGLVILGKMQYDDTNVSYLINEGLYFLGNGPSVTNYTNLGEWPYSSFNIKLVKGLDKELYQVNLEKGICRLDSDGLRECILAPGQSYSITTQGRYYGQGGTVYVGLQYQDMEVYGRPIWDAVVTSDYIYAVPVVVMPDGNEPYLAAAKFNRLGGSIVELVELYDDPFFFDEKVRDNPDLLGLREIEVDSQGNVYVLNTQSLNSSEVLWKYSPEGEILSGPLELTNSKVATDPYIPAPTGLCISDNILYLASGRNEEEKSESKVYAFDTTDLSVKGSFTVTAMEHVTGMTMDTFGNLWIVGLNVDNEMLDSIDSWSGVKSSFYGPRIASISSNELALSEAKVPSDPITGDTDLGLPLSIVRTGENLEKEDDSS